MSCESVLSCARALGPFDDCECEVFGTVIVWRCGTYESTDLDLSFRLAEEHAANHKPVIAEPHRRSPMSARVGCFMVSDLLMKEITDNRDGAWARIWGEFMAQCVIMRAEHLSFREATVYHARSDLFDAIRGGEDEPQYVLEVSKNGDDFSWSIRRCERSVNLPALGAG